MASIRLEEDILLYVSKSTDIEQECYSFYIKLWYIATPNWIMAWYFIVGPQPFSFNRENGIFPGFNYQLRLRKTICLPYILLKLITHNYGGWIAVDKTRKFCFNIIWVFMNSKLKFLMFCFPQRMIQHHFVFLGLFDSKLYSSQASPFHYDSPLYSRSSELYFFY